MIAILISLLVTSAVADQAPRNFAAMKGVFDKAMSCRIKVPSTDVNAMVDSVTCYTELLSPKRNEREQGGLSYWFVSLKKVHKVWACDGNSYQLRSYHEYVPDFLCVRVTEGDGTTAVRLIFFDKVKGQLKISSIYAPPDWAP